MYKTTPFELKLLESVIQLDSEESNPPWKESVWRSLSQNANFKGHTIIDEEDRVLAFVIYREVAGECEILSVATAKSHRRLGLQKTLFAAAEVEWKQSSVDQAWLEVRQSNVAAIGLYERMDFVQFSERENYYRDRNGEAESAILMAKYLF